MSRQFIVTHTATGQQTVVIGSSTHDPATISRRAAHYAPADSTVRSVPRGQEYDLPFDDLPMIIRRPAVERADAA